MEDRHLKQIVKMVRGRWVAYDVLPSNPVQRDAGRGAQRRVGERLRRGGGRSAEAVHDSQRPYRVGCLRHLELQAWLEDFGVSPATDGTVQMYALGVLGGAV
jgi:hypothetical protein